MSQQTKLQAPHYVEITLNLQEKKKKDTRNYCLMNLLEEVAITPEQLCPTQP